MKIMIKYYPPLKTKISMLHCKVIEDELLKNIIVSLSCELSKSVRVIPECLEVSWY